MRRPIYLPAIVSDRNPLYMIIKGKEKKNFYYNSKPINWAPIDENKFLIDLNKKLEVGMGLKEFSDVLGQVAQQHAAPKPPSRRCLKQLDRSCLRRLRQEWHKALSTAERQTLSRMISSELVRLRNVSEEARLKNITEKPFLGGWGKKSNPIKARYEFVKGPEQDPMDDVELQEHIQTHFQERFPGQ